MEAQVLMLKGMKAELSPENLEICNNLQSEIESLIKTPYVAATGNTEKQAAIAIALSLAYADLIEELE